MSAHVIKHETVLAPRDLQKEEAHQPALPAHASWGQVPAASLSAGQKTLILHGIKLLLIAPTPP